MKAFVLMPFSVEFQPVFEKLIRPALEDAGFDVSRADSVLDQQNILNDIVGGIYGADLVVADLTGLNPNVLYELGICHGLNIPAVLLTQDIDEVPFDLRAYRLQVYSTMFHEAEKLSEFLGEIAERHRREEVTFGSPVSDFLRRPPRRSSSSSLASAGLRDGIPREAAGRTSDEGEVSAESDSSSEDDDGDSRDPDQEVGWLDLISERDAVLDELTATYELMTESISEMGARMNERSEQISAIAANRLPGAASSASRVASLAARDMRKHAQDLQNLLPVLEPKSERLVELLVDPRVLKIFEGKEAEQREDVIDELNGLLEANRNSLPSVKHFRNSVQELKDQGISRETNRAAATLRLNLDRVIGALETVESGLVRVISILENNR